MWVVKNNQRFQIDMCSGPLFGKIIRFSIPLMLSNIMQLLFHAADLIVLGRYAPGEAMAAVGATAGLTVLVLNIFFGLATGINVLAARYIGARDNRNLAKTVHTAMAIALYWGAGMVILGLIISKPMLRLMATPDAILNKAALYMWIYCLGIPFVVFYNFGSAILRALGDTHRPLIYMIIAGVVNVVLNLFFVLVFKWDVAGVAVATKISNVVSAWLILRALMKNNDASKLIWKNIRIHWDILKDMLKIGLPAGIQGSFFAISNILIQSAVNSLGWQAIAGNTAASSLEGIVYVGSSAFYFTAISFTGQNYGGKKYQRIIRSIYYCLICTSTFALCSGVSIVIAGRQLLAFYNPDPQIIEWGMIRLKVLLTSYYLCGIMDVFSGSLRGLGHSFKPMLVTLLGVCVFRIFWVMAIFPLSRSMTNLMFSYPVSWTLVSLVNGSILYVVCRKLSRRWHVHNQNTLMS